MDITQHIIKHNKRDLYATQYKPHAKTRASILFCNPMFEERKSTNRAMTEYATFLCSKGFQVLTFDYSGCGDSSGNFEDFSINDWLPDITAAFNFLKDLSPNNPLGIFGLRLGGSLILQHTTQLPLYDFAIAWEPIINGKNYINQELRKKLMKEMITFNKNRETRASLIEQLQNNKTIDLDGYALTPKLYNELCDVNLPHASTIEKPVLFLHINHSNNPTKSVTNLKNLWDSQKNIEFKTILIQPFWNLIGHVNCSTAIKTTYNWLNNIYQEKIENE